MAEIPRVAKLRPDTAECSVCLHVHNTDDLARAAVPGGEEFVWRCRDFSRCAETIHACAQDLHEHDAKHTHLLPRSKARGLMSAPDKPVHEQAWELLQARVREHRAELGVPEPEES